MMELLETMNLPLPEDIEKAKAAGDFPKAGRLIEQYLNEEETPACMKQRLTLEKEVLRRLPLYYPYSEEDAMDLIHEQIPDFTLDELRHYEDIHGADWIYVSHEVRLQVRFFDSLRKVYPEIDQRCKDYHASKSSLLDDNMHYMEDHGGRALHIHMKASCKIKDEVFHPGRVTVHLPVPSPCLNMRNIQILTKDGILAPEDAGMRTICFQEDMHENHPFTVEYAYDSAVPYQDLSVSDVYIDKNTVITEQEPQIVFTPMIRALCKELCGHETNPLVKAWRFYEYCTENVTYAFMREYLTLGNICEYAAAQRIGDCGVKALLFITLCRCAGIPAHWQSGLYVTPDHIGCHDWAMFRIEPYGWLFADPSFGGSAWRAGNSERHAFYFGHLDPYRMAANNAFQQEFIPAKKHWRKDPYDNQSGEIEYEDRGLLMDEIESSYELIDMHDINS